MLLKNKGLVLAGSVMLLTTTAVNAGLHLNPFHHKHKAQEAAAAAPEAATLTPAPPAPVSESLAPYDDVGYATLSGGEGVTASHAALHTPSFVEITNLNTGKTIVAAITTNAPLGSSLVGLSPQAVSLLGGDATGRMPVRVRRVNPPEAEKASLLAGNKGNDRLDTPDMLLNPLRRKLAGTQGVSADVVKALPPAITAPPTPAIIKPKPPVKPVAVHPTPPAPKPAPATAQAAASGTIYLQVAALSSQTSAQAAANKLGAGASVTQAGKFWRVRMGPYANDAQARSALGTLTAKGYRGVRVTH